jgi:hypothetical protein
MPEVNLVADVDQNSTDYQRRIVLQTLSKPKSGALTIKKIVEQLGDHSTYGPIAMELTLDDLYHARQIANVGDETIESEAEEVVEAKPAKKAAKKPAAKAAAKAVKAKAPKAVKAKAPKAVKAKAPKAAKAKAPKAAKEAGTAAKASGEGRKRVDWDHLQSEIHTFLKKAKEPRRTGQICEAVTCSPVQARKALDMLAEAGKITQDGELRGRTYSAA